jgi:glycerol-3-phosphate acyltransferase PlsY
MSEVVLIIILSVIAYFLGSIPSAVWIGKALHGIDVREFGSGNAGATNTFRVLGKKAGSIVLIMDMLKGFLAAYMVNFTTINATISPYQYVNIQLLFGLLAVVGHLFPIFAQFKGGKGIATLFGMIVCIDYKPALLCMGIFLFILLVTRYVSLGSILAAISFPFLMVYVFKEDVPLFIAFGITAALMVVLTHQKNIRKLVNGTENKAKIFPKHRQ